MTKGKAAMKGLNLKKCLSREVFERSYVTQEYKGLLKGELAPRLGVGLNIRF